MNLAGKRCKWREIARGQLLTKVSAAPRFSRPAHTRRSSRWCRPRRRCGGRTAMRARRSPTSAGRRVCRRRCSLLFPAQGRHAVEVGVVSTRRGPSHGNRDAAQALRGARRHRRRTRDARGNDARQHAGTPHGGDPRGLPPGDRGPRPPRAHLGDLRGGIRPGRRRRQAPCRLRGRPRRDRRAVAGQRGCPTAGRPDATRAGHSPKSSVATSPPSSPATARQRSRTACSL